MAREGAAAPNLTRIGALGGEKRWRETGAKKGDFPASNRYDWLLEGTVCYRDFNRLALAASLAKVGVGYGLMLPLFPRRLQHLWQYIFNRLRRNLQSLKTRNVRLWDVVFPHQFDLVSGDRWSRQSF